MNHHLHLTFIVFFKFILNITVYMLQVKDPLRTIIYNIN